MARANQSVAGDAMMRRAMILGSICLLVGIAAGWLIRGYQSPVASASVSASPSPSSIPAPAVSAPAAGDPAQLKQTAETQAAPLLAQLQSDPANAQLLTSVGNLYYDAQQYPRAVEYYGRALKTTPGNASVRTDMATAYWYMGKADTAIAEFTTALTYEPTNPNTLYNRGLVKWQGKKDAAGAVADWKKLLATSPTYDAKDKVQQMLSEVEKAK